MVSFGRFVYYEGGVNEVVKLYAKSKTFEGVKSKKKFKKNIPFISLENERKVWTHLQDLVTRNLEAFETSLKADLEILEQDQSEQFLSNNEKNCIKYRAGEKKVLNRINLGCIMMHEVLDMAEEDVGDAKEFAELTDVLKGIKGYTKKVFEALEKAKKK